MGEKNPKNLNKRSNKRIKKKIIVAITAKTIKNIKLFRGTNN